MWSKDTINILNMHHSVLLLQIKIFKQNWILPNTHYRFGLAYLKVGNKQKAKKEFETALKFKDYTGERRIKYGIESELDKL